MLHSYDPSIIVTDHIARVVLFSRYLHKHVSAINMRPTDTSYVKCILSLYSQILIGIIAGCILCVILTVTDAVPNDPKLRSFMTRTDARSDVLQKASWFNFPYPGSIFTSAVRKHRELLSSPRRERGHWHGL